MGLNSQNQSAHDRERQARLDELWSEIEGGTTDADREATRRAMEELHDDAGVPKGA